jgi:hypothetical protein
VVELGLTDSELEVSPEIAVLHAVPVYHWYE